MGVIQKEDKSPVTLADKEIEAAIRAILAKERPDDGILGEEEGHTNKDAEYQWIIDPIDGTKMFTAGKPNFAALIALWHKTEGFVLGVCDNPVTKDRWWSVKGGKVFWNGREVRSRNVTKIEDAVMATTDMIRVPKDVGTLMRDVGAKARIVVYGSDCANFGLLCSGFIDIIIDRQKNIYDIAPFIPMVQNAGGVLTNISGKPIIFEMEEAQIACATPELYEQVMALYKKTA